MNDNNSNNEASSSAWHQLVIGAGSTAAVVSEESMKCLRYCVSWLQYAIRQLNHQKKLLRSFLVSSASQRKQQQEEPSQLLSTIKADMVSTLRKVIDIITCYASNALPYSAKAAIRETILSLPSRWAMLYDETTNNDVIQQQTCGQEEDVALRLLSFGQESTDMLSTIHVVFDDTIQRAESWLQRLRSFNPMISSSSNDSNNNDDNDLTNLLLAPIRNLHIASPVKGDLYQHFNSNNNMLNS